MELLRTPDERFEGLPGWSFEPRYTEVDGIRIHHIDEGPADGEAVVCLHGEPSWGYLYRTMIPVFTAAGMRVLCPDLVGFGRSDKPTERDDYTYANHVAWMTGWLEHNDVRDATLVAQDWGGLIGLRLVADHPQRFARVVTANTFLPVGNTPPSDAFLAWRRYSQESPTFNAGRIVEGGCATRPLEPAIVAAYDAPFPDDTYKAGARQFPVLVPIAPDDPASADNRRAWEVLRAWTKPWLTAFSDGDPVTAGADAVFQARIPGAAGQPHTTIRGGGHFLQEDRGEQLAQVIVDFIAGTPRAAAD